MTKTSESDKRKKQLIDETKLWLKEFEQSCAMTGCCDIYDNDTFERSAYFLLNKFITLLTESG